MNTTGKFNWLVVDSGLIEQLSDDTVVKLYKLTLVYTPTGESRDYLVKAFHNHPNEIDRIWHYEKQAITV